MTQKKRLIACHVDVKNFKKNMPSLGYFKINLKEQGIKKKLDDVLSVLNDIEKDLEKHTKIKE